MRNAIEGTYPDGVQYSPNERAADVENRLRTYMLNGTEPEELERVRNDRLRAIIASHDARKNMSGTT